MIILLAMRVGDNLRAIWRVTHPLCKVRITKADVRVQRLVIQRRRHPDPYAHHLPLLHQERVLVTIAVGSLRSRARLHRRERSTLGVRGAVVVGEADALATTSDVKSSGH